MEEIARRICTKEYHQKGRADVVAKAVVEGEGSEEEGQFKATLARVEQVAWEAPVQLAACMRKPRVLRFADGALKEVVAGGGSGRLAVSLLQDPVGSVVIVDCGTELYVWLGRGHHPGDKTVAMSLCKQELMAGRPDWVELECVKDRMEPVLFRERFYGWDDEE